MSDHNACGRATTRRRFLTQAGLLAGGLAAGRVRAGDASKAAPVIVGSGEHRYECLHDWLVPPPEIAWGDTQGVAEDSEGRLYVTHTVHPDSKSPNAIVVFDKNGQYLHSWGARFRGGGHGLDLRKEGGTEYLYHCDTAHRQVVKTTLDGTVVWEKGLPEEAGVYKDKAPFIPTNVAFGPDGDFYVADGYGSDWIHQYTIKGEYVRTFGGRGTEPGKVHTAHGVWLDPRGREPFLVVADRSNHRLQYFTLDGKHVRFAADGMRRPAHFSIRGDQLLVPDVDSVLTILDEKDKIVAQLGDGHPSKLRGAPRSEYIPGKFIHPHDAQFLKNGNILVAEWVPTGRLTLLRKIR